MNRWIAAVFVVAFTAGAASAQSPIVIKFSHVVAPDTPKGKGAEKFKELAEKYTNGKVKVEVYSNSTLYKDKEELEAQQIGAVQMLAPSLSKFGPMGIREFEVFDLPYIIPNRRVLRAITDGSVGKKLLARLDSKGIKGLAYWDNGFKIMSANRPLHMPEDFHGLKMRIQSSRVIDAQMRALGATPQITALSEAFQALQTGLVDGTENPPSNMYTQKMDEVQKYATISRHGYLGYAVTVNKKFWEGLPADIRASLEKALNEATAYEHDIAQKENENALEAMKKAGHTTFYELTPEERAAWGKALEPVTSSVTARVGKEVIFDFYRVAHEVGGNDVSNLTEGDKPTKQ